MKKKTGAATAPVNEKSSDVSSAKQKGDLEQIAENTEGPKGKESSANGDRSEDKKEPESVESPEDKKEPESGDVPADKEEPKSGDNPADKEEPESGDGPESKEETAGGEVPESKEDPESENSGESDVEKILFRDTKPDLMESAVNSLHLQGLFSVHYRKEEDDYAIYASTEEFDRARELLIEILKDEADSISERARTLEARRKLRTMETTELAPGFRPEKTPKEKYEDANSTAIAFLLVGALGLAFIVLEYFGIFFSLGLSGNVRYIFYPTMLVMFGVFLAVGFVSLRQASVWKEKMFDEDRIMNNVREYVEHELLGEIHNLLAQRAVLESDLPDEASVDYAGEAQPDPENALLQLAKMIEGESSGASALKEAEEAARTAAPETSEASYDDTETGANAAPDYKIDPDNAEYRTDPGQIKEMENVFNDYYVMEQEIQLRLLKEFPDLPANLLVEATEYVIRLVEKDFEEEKGENEYSTAL